MGGWDAYDDLHAKTGGRDAVAASTGEHYYFQLPQSGPQHEQQQQQQYHQLYGQHWHVEGETMMAAVDELVQGCGAAGELEAGDIFCTADIQAVSISECSVRFRGAVIKIRPESLLPFMPGFDPGTVPFEDAASFHPRDFFIQHHTAVPAANKQVKLNSITPKKLRDLCKQRYQFFYERSNQSKVPWKFLSVVYAEYAGTKVDWADAMCKRIIHALDGVLSGKLRKLHNEKLVLQYLTHMLHLAVLDLGDAHTHAHVDAGPGAPPAKCSSRLQQAMREEGLLEAELLEEEEEEEELQWHAQQQAPPAGPGPGPGPGPGAGAGLGLGPGHGHGLGFQIGPPPLSAAVDDLLALDDDLDCLITLDDRLDNLRHSPQSAIPDDHAFPSLHDYHAGADNHFFFV